MTASLLDESFQVHVSASRNILDQPGVGWCDPANRHRIRQTFWKNGHAPRARRRYGRLMSSPNEKRTKTRALTADVQVPYLGFGTYLIANDEAAAAVREAIAAGYRHIDTAEGYQNESGVGAGI